MLQRMTAEVRCRTTFTLICSEGDKVGRRETLVVMGDLNTTVTVGRDNNKWGKVIGRLGEEVKMKVRERLLRFCVVNEMLMLIVPT